ncbi:hypothetical protein ACIBJF_47105, partial [Streptomyces sp. NPDC050743]
MRENTESTARQYGGLADRARELRWAESDIGVVDADLGAPRAGSPGCGSDSSNWWPGSASARPTRPSDWRSPGWPAPLPSSAGCWSSRLTDTLLIDADGVYDLGDFNDRLVLGLKSTMSEAELHILAGRLHGARKAAAERGDLRLPLPVGMVYADDGTITLKLSPSLGKPREGDSCLHRCGRLDGFTRPATAPSGGR